MYELKPECAKEFNLYFYHFSRAEQSKVIGKIKSVLRKSCVSLFFLNNFYCFSEIEKGYIFIIGNLKNIKSIMKESIDYLKYHFLTFWVPPPHVCYIHKIYIIIYITTHMSLYFTGFRRQIVNLCNSQLSHFMFISELLLLNMFSHRNLWNFPHES